MPRVTPSDLAYFAGIIDGEGCISISCNKGRAAILKLIVVTVDFVLASWIMERFHPKIYERQTRAKNGGHKLYYINWQNGKAEVVLRKVLKFLVIKKERASYVLENWPKKYKNDPKTRLLVSQRLSQYNQRTLTG